jgi:hypothetical protein
MSPGEIITFDGKQYNVIGVDEAIPAPRCADLGRCQEHRVQVNKCSKCWPRFMSYLGGLCGAFTERRIQKDRRTGK